MKQKIGLLFRRKVGLLLRWLGRALKQVGADGIRQRNWYECKSFVSKAVWFVFDTAGLLLVFGLICWLMAWGEKPIEAKLPFFVAYAFYWYLNPVVIRRFRKWRNTKPPVVRA